jgi:hypothetical protein
MRAQWQARLLSRAVPIASPPAGRGGRDGLCAQHHDRGDAGGNSRPIFTDGRIFGLSGAELIEGRVENGRIREVRRLNFALTPVPPR